MTLDVENCSSITLLGCTGLEPRDLHLMMIPRTTRFLRTTHLGNTSRAMGVVQVEKEDGHNGPQEVLPAEPSVIQVWS